MSGHEVSPDWRMSSDPDEPLFPDAASGRHYCSCVELEDGRPVGFVPDVDCPDHGEIGNAGTYANRGTWCPHGRHIYVPDRVDQEPSAYVEADPWPCDDCDRDEVALAIEASHYEASWPEYLS